MAEVDTSSYRAPEQPNPVQTFGNVVGIQNAMNQNRLFQQQYQTNLGLGQIYKEAIDPVSGQLDTTKLNTLIANNPNVTLALPEAIRNSQEAQQRMQGIDQSRVALAKAHLDGLLVNYINPLAQNPNVGSKDVATAIGQAISTGITDPQTATQLWSKLPRDQNGNIQEAQIPAWVNSQRLRVLSAQEQLNALSPAPTIVNNGQQQIPMRLPQIGQPSLAGPAIQNQLPVGTQVYNPQTRQMEFVGPQGGGGGVPAAAPGGGTQGLAAAPPLGAGAAADVDAHASAQQGIALQTRADQTQNIKSILGNMQGELGDFTSGPATESVANLEKLANAQLGLNVDVSKLAAREKFNKLSTMVAQSQFQALGGTGTDKQLGSTELTSPNSELSKLGNQGIIAMLKGNEDAISAKNQAWQAYKAQNGPQSYGQFSTQFNKVYDPRVFQSQYLTPEDNKKLLSGMNKNEQKQFLNSYRYALSQGWVKLPNAQ